MQPVPGEIWWQWWPRARITPVPQEGHRLKRPTGIASSAALRASAATIALCLASSSSERGRKGPVASGRPDSRLQAAISATAATDRPPEPRLAVHWGQRTFNAPGMSSARTWRSAQDMQSACGVPVTPQPVRTPGRDGPSSAQMGHAVERVKAGRQDVSDGARETASVTAVAVEDAGTISSRRPSRSAAERGRSVASVAQHSPTRVRRAGGSSGGSGRALDAGKGATGVPPAATDATGTAALSPPQDAGRMPRSTARSTCESLVSIG